MTGSQGEGASEHVFATLPEIPQRQADASVAAGRLVVALVAVIVLCVTVFAVVIGQLFEGGGDYAEPHEASIGPFEFLVADTLPPGGLVAIALIALVAVAGAAIAFETIAALLSVNPKRDMLAGLREPVGLDTDDDDQSVRVTILVPAHNEEFSLPVTLAALKKQTRAPDRVIVVADNCTDRTVEIALEMGYEAIESVDNEHKKGGALNQALARILPTSGPRDVIMVMDADTSLSPRFLEVGAERFLEDPELSAVGGVFYGEDGNGLIGQFQRNEYARYSLQIRSRHGRVFVLTGTATMFRAEALMDVAAARGVFIPGEAGKVYDTAALTEDNELTLALKSLGATMVSPIECMVTTEIMPTWKNLWVQRKRWQRGALENLSAYGITRATIRYWGQQVGIGYGTVALNLAILLMLITFLAVDQWIWFPFWLVIGFIFLVERVITAWSGGWKARLLAVLLLPELAYDVFLQSVFVKCLIDIARAKRTTWGHVEHTDSATP